jgi:DNA-binding MarR family transcriptional regulator
MGGPLPVKSSDLGHARPADSVSQLLRYTHRAFMRTLEARIAAHGIAVSTWFLLRVLWEQDGLTQAELGERVGIVGPTAVAAMRRLLQDGLAVRRPDKEDKRKLRIFLTPKGRELETVLLPEAAAAIKLATDGLRPQEIAELKRLLRRIALNLGRFVPPAVLEQVRVRVAADPAATGRRRNARSAGR